jgi:hypothetical protein
MVTELVLAQVLPALAAEVEGLLLNEGRDDLASQVGHLSIVDRCRCGDAFCATLYAAPPPQEPWGPGHFTLPLKPRTGHLNVDVLDGRIVELEILFRDEVRHQVMALLP